MCLFRVLLYLNMPSLWWRDLKYLERAITKKQQYTSSLPIHMYIVHFKYMYNKWQHITTKTDRILRQFLLMWDFEIFFSFFFFFFVWMWKQKAETHWDLFCFIFYIRLRFFFSFWVEIEKYCFGFRPFAFTVTRAYFIYTKFIDFFFFSSFLHTKNFTKYHHHGG